MPLQLNLLHEEIAAERQRQRDPLKIGMMVLAGCGALLFLFYAWNAYRTLNIKSKLSAIDAEWKKLEPQVTQAQKRSAELTDLINTTRVLDDYIDNRFFWAPLLEKLSRCVPPNAQLTSIEGQLQDDDKGGGVTLTIDGVAAAREPRSAAEDVRQMLIEQLGKSYHDVKAEFKTLEDIETVASINGTSTPMARYTLFITFNPSATAKPAATPAAGRKKPQPQQKNTDDSA
jgi:Tfp pilus assembly protein PilN